jgi:hypothetical protein
VKTWAWLLIGWVIVVVFVAPLLDRDCTDDSEFDDDWP